jgi:hypothetical protein
LVNDIFGESTVARKAKIAWYKVIIVNHSTFLAIMISNLKYQSTKF